MLILAATKLFDMEKEVNTEKVPLTEREAEVIKCVSAGLSEKEIADKLKIKVRTVRKHLENIRSKTGLTKNTELIGYLVAEINDKPFSLKKLREYGIAIFLLFINVCRIDV